MIRKSVSFRGFAPDPSPRQGNTPLWAHPFARADYHVAQHFAPSQLQTPSAADDIYPSLIHVTCYLQFPPLQVHQKWRTMLASTDELNGKARTSRYRPARTSLPEMISLGQINCVDNSSIQLVWFSWVNYGLPDDGLKYEAVVDLFFVCCVCV